jgi:hypothetical protein
MFANLADRFTNPQSNSPHAAWRDPDKSVTPAKVNTLQPATATTKSNTPNTRSGVSMGKQKRARVSGLTEKQTEALHHMRKERNSDDADSLVAYNAWLQDYLLQGNKISNFYDYPFPSSRFEVVGDMGGVEDKSAHLRAEPRGTYYWKGEDKKAVTSDSFWVPAYTDTIDKQMMADESVPEEIRRHILQGAGKAEEGSRASGFHRAFLEIKSGYQKHQIQKIIDTRNVRYATYKDFEQYTLSDSNPSRLYFDSNRVVYVADPSDVTFPETYGASSLTILLDRKYDVNAWKNKLVRWWDHSTIIGYSGGKLTRISGSNRPHNPLLHDKDPMDAASALAWYADSHRNDDVPALEQTELPMFVDFSKGDGFAFKTFLYENSKLYAFKDANPAEYLATLGAVKVTFVAKGRAVVTADCRKSGVALPLICLTAATPMTQDLTGNTYTVSSVEPGGVLEPAMVTFLPN